MSLEKSKEVFKGYTDSKIKKTRATIICRMGLSESSLTAITKPFSS